MASPGSWARHQTWSKPSPRFLKSQSITRITPTAINAATNAPNSSHPTPARWWRARLVHKARAASSRRNLAPPRRSWRDGVDARARSAHQIDWLWRAVEDRGCNRGSTRATDCHQPDPDLSRCFAALRAPNRPALRDLPYYFLGAHPVRPTLQAGRLHIGRRGLDGSAVRGDAPVTDIHSYRGRPAGWCRTPLRPQQQLCFPTGEPVYRRKIHRQPRRVHPGDV